MGGKDHSLQGLPAEWTNKIPDDDFAYFDDANYCIVLTTQTFVLSSKLFWPEDKELLVYAETIEIPESVNFESRSMSLFCNALKLGHKAISLGVSGKKGDDGIEDAAEAKNGSNSGNIILFVENFDDELEPGAKNDQQLGLYLQANGGRGGLGSKKTTTEKGGAGGAGGNAGLISVYFGHSISEKYVDIYSLIQTLMNPWIKERAKKKLEDLINFQHHTAIAASSVTQFNTAVHFFLEIYEKLTETQDVLQNLDTSSYTDVDKANKERSSLVDQMESSLQQSQVVHWTNDMKTQVMDCFKAADAVRQEPSQETWDSLFTIANKVKATLRSLDRSLEVKKDGLGQQVQLELDVMLSAAHTQIRSVYTMALVEVCRNMYIAYSAAGGEGGLGGMGNKPNNPGDSGAKGAGAEEKKQLDSLLFAEDLFSVNIPHAWASPEQCQMLLNRADLLYFTSSQTSNFEAARLLYAELSRRLSCVPNLLSAIKGKKPSSTIEAYLELEHKKLTFKPIQQLMAIKLKAEVCLTQISNHQNFQGYTDGRVPRFTHPFYLDRANTSIETIKSLEDLLGTYGSNTRGALAAVKSNTEKELQEIDLQIDELTGSNGILATSATRIEAYTPAMKKAKAEISKSIETVNQTIKDKLNTDPKIFLDALTMVAFCPNKVMGGIQALSVYQKCTSTVQALDGTSVEKAYVVNRFQRFDADFASLSEHYKTLSTGAINVDDPGANKLIAEKADIENLLDQYRTAIGDAESIKKEFNSFVDLVKKRNDAVVSYNSAIQALLAIRSKQDQYKAQKEIYGEQFLSMDPNIPTGRFWMRNLINDARLAAVRALTDASRAISYLALVREEPFSQIYDGLPASTELTAYRKDLDGRWKDSIVQQYAKVVYNQFPGYKDRQSTERNAVGLFYAFTPAEVKRFLQSPNSNSKGIYTAAFTVPLPTKDTNWSYGTISGYWDLRIDQVHAWLFGASFKKGAKSPRNVKIGLTHIGYEKIVKFEDGKDTIFDFSHDKIYVEFQYEPEGIDSIEAVKKAGIGSTQQFSGQFSGIDRINWKNGQDLKGALAPVSPFCEWLLSVNPKQNNDMLDLSTVTGIAIDFWGDAAPYPQTN